MKNNHKFLLILTFVIVLLFYRVDSVVAMENAKLSQSVAFTVDSIELERSSAPVAAPEGEEEEIADPAAKPEEEETADPAAKPEEEEAADSAAKPEEEGTADSAVKPEEEEAADTTGKPEEEGTADPAAKPEEGGTADPAVKPAEAEPEQIIEPATVSSSSRTPDIVSTGPALIEWLESHKNTGGMVKLADHVVLDGYYCFCPNGINKPDVHVDTDQYTITVTGEIEFMSNNHLTFSGQPDDDGIFYVAAKGMLSMVGVTVESRQCALWQEEGAGLQIADCRIAGSLHYADTPFVMEQNLVCVVVNKGQTLNDVLPSQISCTVNRQGNLTYNERVPITWNLEGCDKQQEERRRFQLQGSFLHAASAAPVSCTVVYNDYPLTFTDVKASVSGRMYIFKGGYTKPEDALPITVMSEYSLDGDNWTTYDETNVTYSNTGFFIAFESEKRDATVHPNIYIRLHWNDNGTRYYSNVLCFAFDNLEHAEDIGGSRGGGTSITNPPGEPQKSTSDTASKEEKPTTDTHRDTDTDSGGTELETSSDTNQTESEGGSISPEAEDGGQVLSAVPSNINAGQSANAQARNNADDQSSYTESKASDADPDKNESENRNDSDISKKQTVTALSVNGENSTNSSTMDERTLRSGIREGNAIVIAVGFVLLSVIAGIAGFCLHSRSGTNR